MDLTPYKEKLEDELASLTAELARVGRVNPDNPKDWEAVPEEMDTDSADANSVADKFEEFEANEAILNRLELRYNEVKDAINRIETGTYGTCMVCGKQIEADRLEANPAATTCKEHREE